MTTGKTAVDTLPLRIVLDDKHSGTTTFGTPLDERNEILVRAEVWAR